jgi:excisionase family DNA binding protein
MATSIEADGDPLQRKTLQPRLCSVKQAAFYLSLSKWTVYAMIEHEVIPCVRRGKRKLVDIRDLDKWIDDHKEGGDA